MLDGLTKARATTCEVEEEPALSEASCAAIASGNNTRSVEQKLKQRRSNYDHLTKEEKLALRKASLFADDPSELKGKKEKPGRETSTGRGGTLQMTMGGVPTTPRRSETARDPNSAGAGSSAGDASQASSPPPPPPTPPPPQARRPTNDAVADALMQRITLEAARKAAARSAAARAKREERERATAATQKV